MNDIGVSVGHGLPALLVGLPTAATWKLAGALRAQLQEVPPLLASGTAPWAWIGRLGQWEDDFQTGQKSPRVVICTWDEPRPPAPLTAMSGDEWHIRVELPLARWFAAVRGGIARCAPGGAVVVVAERPAAIDSANRADLEALGEGLSALVRSSAFIAGDQGIRVNLVTSAIASVPDVLHGLAPPLDAFPGTAEREIAGAVRLLLSDDAVGITGMTVTADCGRSW